MDDIAPHLVRKGGKVNLGPKVPYYQFFIFNQIDKFTIVHQIFKGGTIKWKPECQSGRS